MRMAQKKFGKRVKAWRLGESSDMYRELIARKKIRVQDDGQFALFSLEATRGGQGGEIAQAGDWFKVDELDGELYPYPIAADWFLANHIYIDGDTFEQISKPLPVWFTDDPVSAEVSFLIRTGALTISDSHVIALIWDTTLVVPKDECVVVFYDIKRTGDGEIVSVDFNLVANFAFQRDYQLIE